MPDHAIFKIVELMDVPKAKRLDAALEILSGADSIWLQKHTGHLHDNFECFKRIANKGNDLLQELDRLNLGGKAYLAVKGVQYAAMTRQLIKAVRDVAPEEKRPANRPRGKVAKKNRELNWLIYYIAATLFSHGGKLTLGFSSDRGERRLTGSLPAVLKIFHASFPDLIPENPPYQTLRQMWFDAKSSWRNRKAG
jgi:hypothetical protein